MGRKLKIFMSGLLTVAAVGGLLSLEAVRSKIIDVRAEHASAQELFTYANLYQAGLGVKQDPIRAAKYARRAADMGHAMSQHRLGFYYDTGFLGARDIPTAVHWYKKSAGQDMDKSHFALASIFWSGDLGNIDTHSAIAHDTRAGELGMVQSNLRLGVIYQDGGKGVKTDHARANHYLVKALKQGSPEAAYRMGNQFWQGHGVETDLKMGAAMYFVAHHLGYSRDAYTYALEHLEPGSEREVKIMANAYVMLELCPHLDRAELCEVKGANDQTPAALRGAISTGAERSKKHWF